MAYLTVQMWWTTRESGWLPLVERKGGDRLSQLGAEEDTESHTAISVLAKARTENFTVASMLLPRASRADLMAIYGFARLADDIGDEADGDRLAQLDWLESELARAAEGTATNPLLVAVTPFLRDKAVSREPFEDLIEANRRDQRVASYETFEDLVGYCRLSAVPVGRLVLAAFDLATPERVGWSDDVCIGLQLVEHLQDVGEDARRGRVYLPQAELRTEGVREADLIAPHASPGLRRVVALTTARARGLLGSGAPLCASLPMRQRIAVSGFASGGLAVTDAIVQAGYDVLGSACKPRARRVGLRSASMLWGAPTR